jgi:hypothetical protein
MLVVAVVTGLSATAPALANQDVCTAGNPKCGGRSASAQPAISTAMIPATAQAKLDGIEVTQAIQDLKRSVPLISAKATFARVYLSGVIPGVAKVNGSIRMVRNGVTIATVSALQPTAFGSTILRARRENWMGALDFKLPVDATAPGTVTIELAQLSDAQTGNPIACAQCSPVTVTFKPAPPLRIRILGMSYVDPTTGDLDVPRDADFLLLASWLARAYPVASVIWSRGEVASTLTPPFQNDVQPMSCAKANAVLSGYRADDMSNGADPRTHYYGLISDKAAFFRGCSGVPASADPGSTASGPAGQNWQGDTDASYADWYGGHELGHSFGRLHPGSCGDSKDDSAFPYKDGFISDPAGSFVGLDTGDQRLDANGTVLNPSQPGAPLPVTVIPGRVGTEVMSYCNLPQWLSSYTYQGIFRRLADEDLKFSPGPHLLKYQSAAAPLIAGSFVHVSALVDLAMRRGSIEQVLPVRRTEPLPDANADVQLVLLDSSGKELRRINVRATALSEQAPGSRAAAVNAAVPLLPGLAQIALLVRGTKVDTYKAGLEAPPAPVAPRLSRNAANLLEYNGDERVQLSWSTSPSLVSTRELASTGVRYIVEVQRPGGRWEAVALNVTEPSVDLRLKDVAGRPLRIFATNGLRSSSPTTVTPIGGAYGR